MFKAKVFKKALITLTFMVEIFHNENHIVIPVVAVIFLVSLAVVVLQHFTGASFGFLGFIAWLIVILGALYFVIWVITQIFG